jgi:hypothetical protein
VQAMPGLLAALLGLATLVVANGQPTRAIVPLRLVQAHPASSQAQKEQAEQFLTASGGSPEALSTVPVPELATYVQAQLAKSVL